MNKFERELSDTATDIAADIELIEEHLSEMIQDHRDYIYDKPTLHFQLYSRQGRHEFYRIKHGYNCGDMHMICKRSRKCSRCDMTEIDMFMGGFVCVAERLLYKIYERTQ